MTMMIKVPKTIAPPTAAPIATLLSFPFVCDGDGDGETSVDEAGNDDDDGDGDGVCDSFPVEVGLGGLSVDIRNMGTGKSP